MMQLYGLLIFAALIVVIIVTFSFLGWLTERSLSRRCDKRAVEFSARAVKRIADARRTRALYYSEQRKARERHEKLCQRRVGK